MLTAGWLLKPDSIEAAAKQFAAQVQGFAGKYVPVGLALLAAVLVTLLFFKAQGAGKRQVVGTAKKRKRTYSATEVAEHNSERDAWIILKNKVYDVSPYVEEHPGGRAILRNAGRDATKGFFGPQHPDRVFDLIDDFYIGDLLQD